MRVAVFGLGYVGTVTAAVLAAHGHDVVGVDVDTTKVDAVAAATSPVVEPGLDELVATGSAAGRLRASTTPGVALAGAELSLVCVGTPSSATGGTDLQYVARAVEGIAEALADAVSPSGHHAVVLRSTVPPGTVDELVAPALAARCGPSGAVGVGMCPEFLREGSAIEDFCASPLNVVGTHDPRVGEAMQRLLWFAPRPVEVVPTRDAEALKYACNAFHATKVSFVNELGRLFRVLGVDTRRVMDLFRQDTQLNISTRYLSPGFAFGGSCLPKDLRSLLHLARMSSIDLPLLAGALASNTLTVAEVVNRVVATDARSVALLGLSFKPGSDDLRESPYVALAETLIGKGFDVRIYDPVVDTPRLVGANRQYLVSRLPHVQRTMRPSATAALEGADLALVSIGTASVVDALRRHPPRFVMDLHGRLGPAAEELVGYEGATW